MLSPEQIGVFNAPVDRMGGHSSGSIGLENPRQVDQQNLVLQVRAIQKDSVARTYFEYFKLARTGLLDAMEQAGIVPSIPDSPNPIDPEENEDLHEQWWKNHPEDAERFRNLVDQREQILDYIYLGAAIGHLLDEITTEQKVK